MEEIIKKLQIEVYRLDWRIGETALELKKLLENPNSGNSWDAEKYKEYYKTAVSQRKEILESIDKLSSI